MLKCAPESRSRRNLGDVGDVLVKVEDTKVHGFTVRDAAALIAGPVVPRAGGWVDEVAGDGRTDGRTDGRNGGRRAHPSFYFPSRRSYDESEDRGERHPGVCGSGAQVCVCVVCEGRFRVQK